MLSKTLFVLLGFCVMVLSARVGQCEEPEPASKTLEKYRKLVQQLASPNKEPVITNRSQGSAEFPADYDRTAQVRINEARKVLYENFEEAFPALVEAMDNGGYCMTINWADGDAYYNRWVGSICKEIIASHLEVYRDKLGPMTKIRWQHYNYKVISKEWGIARKDRSLVELQVEAIDWAIERRMAEPEKNLREEHANEVDDLRKLRDKISKSKVPSKPRKLMPMITSNKNGKSILRVSAPSRLCVTHLSFGR